MLSRRSLLIAPTLAGASVLLAPSGPPSAAAATAADPGLPGVPLLGGLLGCDERYLGYRDVDRGDPWARFMSARTSPVQPQVAQALTSGPVPSSEVPAFADLPRDLAPTGYSAIENGYGRAGDGRVWVAALTTLPRNRAAHWDWWFGWHSRRSSRYKLWHPEAHAFAALRDDRGGVQGLSDRQRYLGNTSYVDEYIGSRLEQLAITFVDPASRGFVVPRGQTVVVGQVGSPVLGVQLGWLAHQVRPTPGGAEMRSRFHLNVADLTVPDLRAAACAFTRGVGDTLTQPIPFPVDFGRDLLEHCGREMAHLGGFLPALYAAFRDVP